MNPQERPRLLQVGKQRLDSGLKKLKKELGQISPHEVG